MANKAVATATETLPAVRTEPVDLVAGAVSVQALTAQVDLLHQCMAQRMRIKEHYGYIPGCDKPTLFQKGGDLISVMFRLRTDYEVLSSVRQDSMISYAMKANLVHWPSGQIIATGVGLCNSREKCILRLLVGRGTPLWDVENTIFKRAAKRARMTAICAGTAASEVFVAPEEEAERDDPGLAPEEVKTAPPTPPVREPGEEDGELTDASTPPPPGGPDPWAEWQAVSRQLTETEMEKVRDRAKVPYLTPATGQVGLSRAILAAKAVLSERR